jgi:hypothetical protein
MVAAVAAVAAVTRAKEFFKFFTYSPVILGVLQVLLGGEGYLCTFCNALTTSFSGFRPII